MQVGGEEVCCCEVMSDNRVSSLPSYCGCCGNHTKGVWMPLFPKVLSPASPGHPEWCARFNSGLCLRQEHR